MTAALMSSGSAHAIGMALIPLNASATSAGTFSAPSRAADPAPGTSRS
jgi:hypothetical protein